MINYFCTDGHRLNQFEKKEEIEGELIWVDLIDSTQEEKDLVEKEFGIELFTEQESAEIESSSKFLELDDEIGINLNFMSRHDGDEHYEPVSFIIKNKILYTERDSDYRTFIESYKKIKTAKPIDGDDVFILILDTRIDFLADYIEEIADKISLLTKQLVHQNKYDQNVIYEIAAMQDQSMGIRENIIEIQRIISSWSKSKLFPGEEERSTGIMVRDLDSLMEHTSFNFSRLEYLQNAFQGLVDVEQNRIMKVFTIITVIFVPPTFIAGLYGMNFEIIPELKNPNGYYYALGLMFLSVITSLSVFKWKKWI